MYKLAFSPIKIGNLKLPNRIVMVPVITNFCDERGRLTHREIAFIRKRVEGGPWLLYLGSCYLEQRGKLLRFQLGLDTDSSIKPLKDLINEIHGRDVKVGIQLMHGGRCARRKITGLMPVAPSAIRIPFPGFETPLELSVKQIEELISTYTKAAIRAQMAGADVIELHCTHCLLIHQFLSPLTNKRADSYGGGIDSRLKFLLEIITNIKKNINEDSVLSCRISGDDMIVNGINPKDYRLIACKLEKAGVDLISISVGTFENNNLAVGSRQKRPGYLMGFAKNIKDALKVPVIGVGRIISPYWVEKSLKNKLADLVGIGRQLIADTNFPRKMREGDNRFNRCIACQECYKKVTHQLPINCLVNPQVGNEYLVEKERTLNQLS